MRASSRCMYSVRSLHATEMVAALGPAFMAGQQHTDPLEYIEVLRDQGAINERFAELQAAIRDEILVFTKPPYAKPPQENLEGLEVSRTHVARSVYELSALEEPAVAAGIRRFIPAFALPSRPAPVCHP